MQRALDASLAKAMASAMAATERCCLLARDMCENDWAVSHQIRSDLPDATVVSVAFIEVDPKRTTPSEYMKTVPWLGETVWFILSDTDADLTDHCAEIENHLKTKKAEKAGER